MRVGHELHVLLDRDHHVAEHRGAAGAGDGEEVREAGERRGRGTSAARPPTSPARERPVAAADVDAQDGAGHGVEAAGEDEHVERVLRVADAQPALGELVDRRLAHRHELDVGAGCRPRSSPCRCTSAWSRTGSRTDTAARRSRGRRRARGSCRARSRPRARWRAGRGTCRSRRSAGRSRRRGSAPRAPARAPPASPRRPSPRGRTTGCRRACGARARGTRRSAPCARGRPPRTAGRSRRGWRTRRCAGRR